MASLCLMREEKGTRKIVENGFDAAKVIMVE